MAVKIRLSRVGTTNRPYYRIVVADGRNKRDGEILTNVGSFDPINNKIAQFHEDIYQAWLSKGAIPTDSVKKIYRLYKKSGTTVASKSVAQEAVVTEKVAE
jgi:small subunit ribosomal protein S16